MWCIWGVLVPWLEHSLNITNENNHDLASEKQMAESGETVSSVQFFFLGGGGNLCIL